MVDTFVELQEAIRPWALHNFPTTSPTMILLGVMEELGELTHAHLKKEQGIRKSEDHEALKKDSVGDIIIFLADYCNRSGYDLDSIINLTWAHVSKRDWVKFPNNGTSE